MTFPRVGHSPLQPCVHPPGCNAAGQCWRLNTRRGTFSMIKLYFWTYAAAIAGTITWLLLRQL